MEGIFFWFHLQEFVKLELLNWILKRRYFAERISFGLYACLRIVSIFSLFVRFARINIEWKNNPIKCTYLWLLWYWLLEQKVKTIQQIKNKLVIFLCVLLSGHHERWKQTSTEHDTIEVKSIVSMKWHIIHSLDSEFHANQCRILKKTKVVCILSIHFLPPFTLFFNLYFVYFKQ